MTLEINNQGGENPGLNSSILNRVLEEQNEAQKQDIKLRAIISQLLGLLSEQEAEVVRRRYALIEANEVKRQTLELIGKHFGVTRERVRQIENKAINKIKSHDEFKNLITPAEAVILEILEEHGGLAEENYLINKFLEFTQEGITSWNKQIMLFLLHKLLDEKLERVDNDSEYFLSGWKTKLADVERFKNILETLHDYVEKQDKPVIDSDLIKSFKEHYQGLNLDNEELREAIILSALEISAKIKKNAFEEWGLKHWKSITPKRVGDKIYLILEKIGKPLHFAEIAAAINKQNFDKKIAHPATVHNELIMSDDYVLVGRGVYALKKWGYRPGIVADIIKQVLSQRPEPLTLDEITDKVLEQRLVKKATVVSVLSNGDLFKKLGDGRYVIVSE